MEKHFAIIRDGNEISRITAHHYTQDIIPPRFTFYDAFGAILTEFIPRIGDVVRPTVIGFHDPYPPIDQSPERIRELTAKMRRLEAAERFWVTARSLDEAASA